MMFLQLHEVFETKCLVVFKIALNISLRANSMKFRKNSLQEHANQLKSFYYYNFLNKF